MDVFYEKANELKIIVYNKSDIQWAEQHKSKINSNCRCFLQPEWSKQKDMIPIIVDYIKENPGWEISLQIHKILNIP